MCSIIWRRQETLLLDSSVSFHLVYTSFSSYKDLKTWRIRQRNLPAVLMDKTLTVCTVGRVTRLPSKLQLKMIVRLPPLLRDCSHFGEGRPCSAKFLGLVLASEPAGLAFIRRHIHLWGASASAQDNGRYRFWPKPFVQAPEASRGRTTGMTPWLLLKKFLTILLLLWTSTNSIIIKKIRSVGWKKTLELLNRGSWFLSIK